MDLIQLVLVLVVIGVLLALLNRYIPDEWLDPKIKRIINIVVVIAVILWVLSIFLPGLPSIRVGKPAG